MNKKKVYISFIFISKLKAKYFARVKGGGFFKKNFNLLFCKFFFLFFLTHNKNKNKNNIQPTNQPTKSTVINDDKSSSKSTVNEYHARVARFYRSVGRSVGPGGRS